MLTRKLNRWKCELLGENGDHRTRTLAAYWDPEKVMTESVAQAAAAMETVVVKHATRFAGLSAQLVDA